MSFALQQGSTTVTVKGSIMDGLKIFEISGLISSV